ncbi:EamA family transporter RarD [Oricola cellulosilytica]|uniref:EamA family transporter RarD n=1 Tax=Oricola cellulosilytica TaxID=1429082 RepID=A0A4R0PCY5_9HYPH|nr:EamA family transporter RarD [Oricola cellulosilytica]TCD14278.1 EamA family transporter RarD [Oricola cellulosilytica]
MPETVASVPSARQAEREPLAGFAYALGAYIFWGFLPFYMKAVDHIAAYEVVAHRVVWSVPVAGVILILMRRTADLRAAFRSPRTLALAALTAGLISINWGVYVWAVAAERTVEAALGYYINPLVNVLLGAVFLGERFNRLQAAAIACAVIAVGILTVKAGGLPWVSLTLAFSFGFYGFLRKTLPIGPTQGFMLEVILLSLPATVIIGWLVAQGEGHFGPTGPADIGLLLLAGPATAFPLILYAFGAKALRYTTIGIVQYLTPTMIFLVAVFFFGEPFSLWQLIAFGFIWTALLLYTTSLLRR